MKNILLLTLFAFAQSSTAGNSLPYPVIIAPPAMAPNFQSAAAQAMSLMPTLQVYPAPVPVRAVRPATVRAVRPVTVAVPIRR